MIRALSLPTLSARKTASIHDPACCWRRARSELFLISQSHPCHHLEHSLIEFEVRDGSRLIWANDTVLERLERYAREDLAELEAKLPSSETEVDAALIDSR